MGRPVDLRRIASRQRWLLRFVLAGVISLWPQMWVTAGLGRAAIGNVPAPFLIGVQLAAVFATFALAILLMIASGVHPFYIAFAGLVGLVPYLNLVVLFLSNRVATNTLRKAGLRVGLWGVDPKQREWVLNLFVQQLRLRPDGQHERSLSRTRPAFDAT